jgi:hypothetical protein
MMTILKYLGWWFAISLTVGVTWGMVVTIWSQVQERRLAAAVIKYMEELDEHSHD